MPSQDVELQEAFNLLKKVYIARMKAGAVSTVRILDFGF